MNNKIRRYYKCILQSIIFQNLNLSNLQWLHPLKDGTLNQETPASMNLDILVKVAKTLILTKMQVLGLMMKKISMTLTSIDKTLVEGWALLETTLFMLTYLKMPTNLTPKQSLIPKLCIKKDFSLNHL